MYIPVAQRSSTPTGMSKGGYVPVAERGKVEAKITPPIFATQPTSTQTTTPTAIDKGQGTGQIIKDIFTGRDDTAGGFVRNTVAGLPRTGVEVAKNVAIGLKDQFLNPSEIQKKFESDLDKMAKSPVEKYIALPILKGTSRLLSPAIEPLAQDISEIKYVSEKGGLADQVAEGKMPASYLEELAVLHKTAPQIVGDVAQAVLSAYAGGEAQANIARNSYRPFVEALKRGGATGLEVGTAFGAAQAASSGSKNPLEIASIVGTSGAAGGILGALISGAFPLSKEAMAKVKEAKTLYDSMTPEERQRGALGGTDDPKDKKTQFSGSTFKQNLPDEYKPFVEDINRIARGEFKHPVNDGARIATNDRIPNSTKPIDILLNKENHDKISRDHGQFSPEDLVVTAQDYEKGVYLPASNKTPEKINLIKETPDGGIFVLGANRFNGYGVVTFFEHYNPAKAKQYLASLDKRGIVIPAKEGGVSSSIRKSGVSASLSDVEAGKVNSSIIAKRSDIDKSINPSSPKITRSEDVLLRERLRNQARGARAGFKEGYAEAREEIINSLTNKFENKIERIERKGALKELKTNIKVRDFDRVRGEIVEYAKKTLPVDERGKLITMVSSAKTQKDLIKAFLRIDRQAQEVVKKSLASEITKTAQKIADSKRVDVEYRKRISDLLGDFELKGHREETIKKLEATQKFLESERAKGKDVSMPSRVIEKLQILARTSIEDLTISQLEGLKGEIELLQKLGETKARTKEALYENEKTLIKEDLLKSASPIESKDITRTPGEKVSFKGQVANRFKEIFNRLRKARLSLRPIDGLAELTGMEKMKERFDLNYGNYLTHNDTFLKERAEILDRLKLSPEQMERIGIYAAREQVGGYEKLENSGITREQADVIKLIPEEKEYYDFGRKWFESDYPSVKEYMKDVYNQDVGKVDNYVSFQTDFQQMSELDIYERFGTLADEAVKRTKTAEKGFTEARSGAGNQKIRLDFDQILLRHKDDVAYLLNMGRDTKMYSEIVNSKEMKAQLGDVGSLAWLEWLDLMARKGGADQAKQIAMLDFLRRNVGAGVLPFKLSSALVQLSSFADAGGTIGGKWATSGAFDIATSKEARAFVMDNFPEIKAAIGDDVAFLELEQSWLGKASKVGIMPLKKLDGLMRSTTAIGAYKKIAAERGVPVDFANPDPAIVAEATKLVRQSQGSSFFKDQPLAITKGQFLGNRSLDKALFQFQSFMLNRWENIERQIWRQGFKTGNYAQAISGFTWLVVVSTALEMGLRSASKKALDLVTVHKSKEDEITIQSLLGQQLGNVPVVGNITNSLMYDSNPVPIIQSLERASKGVYKTFTGASPQSKTKGAVDAVAGGANLIFGVPGTTQASQIAKNLIGDAPTKKKSGGVLPSLPTLPKLPALPALPKIGP